MLEGLGKVLKKGLLERLFWREIWILLDYKKPLKLILQKKKMSFTIFVVEIFSLGNGLNPGAGLGVSW